MSDLPDDLEELLGIGAHGYFAGGAGDEITLRDNEASWSRFALQPRVLVDVQERDPSVEVLGRRRANPVVVAPMAYQRHVHETGERGSAAAARAAGCVYGLSTQSTTSPADVADVLGDHDRWFQLYVFKDRQISFDLVAEARDSGYEALVLTVDFPVAGWRERDKRSGFKVEHPIAINPSGPALTTEQIFAMHDESLTWDDVAQFAETAQRDYGMPLLLKGILRPDDAERAIDAGAAGIVVSNHGGRQLDTTLSGADALGPIVQVVQGRVDLLVDGGIRRGWDVAKALALGANAVMVGRPVLWGLARGGAAGAEAVLRQILDELDTTLALLGCPRAADLDGSFVGPAPWIG